MFSDVNGPSASSAAGCTVCQMSFPLALWLLKNQFLLGQALQAAAEYIVLYSVYFNKSQEAQSPFAVHLLVSVPRGGIRYSR